LEKMTDKQNANVMALAVVIVPEEGGDLVLGSSKRKNCCGNNPSEKSQRYR